MSKSSRANEAMQDPGVHQKTCVCRHQSRDSPGLLSIAIGREAKILSAGLLVLVVFQADLLGPRRVAEEIILRIAS